MVKNKLKEQIMEELYGINMEDDEDNEEEEKMEFKEDLARAQGAIEGPIAYGGNEFSFL